MAETLPGKIYLQRPRRELYVCFCPFCEVQPGGACGRRAARWRWDVPPVPVPGPAPPPLGLAGAPPRASARGVRFPASAQKPETRLEVGVRGSSGGSGRKVTVTTLFRLHPSVGKHLCSLTGQFFFKGVFPHSHSWRPWTVERCLFTLWAPGRGAVLRGDHALKLQFLSVPPPASFSRFSTKLPMSPNSPLH